MINHTNKKPNANADRFIKMPKNKQKEKNPNSFIKKANTYSVSENT